MTSPPRLSVRPWIEAGCDLLFPPRCRLCSREGFPIAGAAAGQGAAGAPHPAGVPFCPPCVVGLIDGGARCRRCGGRGGDGDRCGACRGRPADHDGIVVLGSYGDDLRDAVLRAKRPAGRDVATGLARLLHARHAATIAAWSVDVVVPVPMHWWRRLLRGGNAVDLLAAGVARAAGLPVARPVRRRRATMMQNRQPLDRRRAAVSDAFVARPAGVRGRRVLLVDDVLTTGGTVAACRRALVDAGAAAVFVAVIARADHGDDDGVPAADRPSA